MMLFLYSDIYWIDAGVPLEKYINLKPYQVCIHVYNCMVYPMLSNRNCLQLHLNNTTIHNACNEYVGLSQQWQSSSAFISVIHSLSVSLFEISNK